MREPDSSEKGAKQDNPSGSFTLSKVLEKKLRDHSAEYTFDILFSAPIHAQTINHPELVDYLVATYPNLKKHRCDNNKCASFVYELKNTEMAHAFEHAIVEHIALAGIPRRQILGKTGWRKRGRIEGPYRIVITAPINREAFQAALCASMHDFKRFLG